MPPKLQIKPKAPPGGRRGGRGAGAAAGTDGAGAGATGAIPASTTTTSTDSAPTTTTTSNTPNPAATAATTRSIAPPAGRLDSLKTQTPGTSTSGSGTPAPSGAAGRAGAEGGLRGKAPLRFKPKAVVRRTAEERAKLEATVAPASVTPGPNTGNEGERGAGRGGFSGRGQRGSGDRGRGRGGRGRGGGRGGADFGAGAGAGAGAGGYQSVASTASGPFGMGSVTSGRSRVIHERGAELPTGTGKSKRASKGISALDPDGVRIKSERGDDPDYYSSTEEESDGGPKVNVERMIEMIDSEEDDEDESPLKGVDKIPVMFPLRLGRIKHEEKERAVPIFKDLDTGKKGGKGGGGRKVKLEEGGVTVKTEPTDDNDIAVIDAPSLTDQPQPPSSPELSKKLPTIKHSSPEAKRARRKSSGTSRRRRPSHVLSPEEEMEIKMEDEDRAATLHELGLNQPSPETDVAEDFTSGIKSGDLFFFQFPTILPPLEPIVEPVPALVPGELGSGSGSGSGPINLDAAGSKPAPAPAAQKKKPAAGTQAKGYHVRAPLPDGLVGQLRVHKSGKVTVLWGNPEPAPPAASAQPSTAPPPGTNTAPAKAGGVSTSSGGGGTQPIEMVVSRGAQCEFLQDIVVINPTPQTKKDGETAEGGGEGDKAGGKEKEGGAVGVVNAGLKDPKTGKNMGGVWSLGQVRGKFVVSPDFDRLVAAGGGGGAAAGGR